eukprot:2119148-Pyramimonas_sp.AAC.2
MAPFKAGCRCGANEQLGMNPPANLSRTESGGVVNFFTHASNCKRMLASCFDMANRETNGRHPRGGQQTGDYGEVQRVYRKRSQVYPGLGTHGSIKKCLAALPVFSRDPL